MSAGAARKQLAGNLLVRRIKASSFIGGEPFSTDGNCPPSPPQALNAFAGLRGGCLEPRRASGETAGDRLAYPPGWVTLPVATFGLTDRADIFSRAALTMILVAATLALLVGLKRVPLGAVGRRT